MAFFPDYSKEAAMNNFRVWLKTNPRLQQLVDRRIHTFTPAQVKMICIEVGKPYEYE